MDWSLHLLRVDRFWLCLCNIIFLVTKELWEFEPPRKNLAARKGRIALGEDWQELVMGKFDRGNQWTWIWKYFCDSAAGSLNDMLNDVCGS